MMLLQDPLPWEYLLTLERGGLPEVSYSGVLSVWAGGHGNLMSLGNVEAPLWSRSLLKPFQLMAILPVLKDAYPMLTLEHYGVMMASQNGEPHQQALLKELLDLGCLKETDLQCPGCYPMAAQEKFKLKLENAPISPLYHPCSGKHIAQLLAYTALGMPFTHYLDPESFCFQSTLSLMSFLLGKEPEVIPLSVDGCKMPNIAISASEMASLYCDLSQDLPEERKKGASPEVLNILAHWSEIRQWIHSAPTVFGGENRLDSRLIQPGYFKKDLNCIAKEGADGLLALGFPPGPRFKKGLGMLLKLATGYDPVAMELVLIQVLHALGIHPSDEVLARPGVCIETPVSIQPYFQTLLEGEKAGA